MKTINEINEQLDHLSKYIFENSDSLIVIELFRKRLYRLTNIEEKMITCYFNVEMFIEILPFIVNSLNFFKHNTITLPAQFQQDLVLKYIENYDQIISSTEDLFVKHKMESQPQELLSQ